MSTTAAENSTSIDQLRSEGWCILHDVVPVDVARQTRYDLYRIGSTCGVIAQAYNANLPEIPFYTRVSVVKDCQRFVPYLTNSRVTSVLHAALGQKLCITATTMQIHEFGTPAGPWHVGEPFDSTSTSLLRSDRAAHLTLVWMFSDFYEGNGGYKLLQASHRRNSPVGTEACAQPGELHVSGTLGSVLITDSRTWRAIAANEDDLIRLCVVIGFAPLPERGTPPRDERSVLAKTIFEKLPDDAKPLFQHWVR
jgi:hypothetical protein